MKMLCWSDSPVAQTGLGRVSKQLLKIFKDIGFDITVSAINHNFPYYPQDKYPYKIYQGFMGGDDLGVGMTKALLQSEKWDVFFVMNDVNVILQIAQEILIAKKNNPNMVVIAYPPMDVDYTTEGDGVLCKLADKVIWWTPFAFDLAVQGFGEFRDKMYQIPFGFDTERHFRTSNKRRNEYRRNAWGVDNDTYVIGCVNRNQWRKDYFRLIYAFALFNKKHPKSLLYIHAKDNDMGGSLSALASAVATWLKIDKKEFANKVMIPDDASFNTAVGFSQKELNLIYNSMDLHVTTNQGEGWGLTTAEAMCCETPFIVPDNTTGSMFAGENEERGLLVKCGETYNDWVVNYGQRGGSLLPRPIVDVHDLVEKMEFAYKNDLTKQVKNARMYATENSWSAIAEQWKLFFKKAG